MSQNERRRNELETMVASLDEILRSDELHVPLEYPGREGRPSSLASLGLLLRRLEQLEAAGEASDVTRQAREELARARERHPRRLDERLVAELDSMIKAYQYFVRGVEARDESSFENYSKEVDVRLQAERLLERAGDDGVLAPGRARLQELGQRLRPFFEEGGEAVLDDGFPVDRGKLWWLFGAPKLPAD